MNGAASPARRLAWQERAERNRRDLEAQQAIDTSRSIAVLRGVRKAERMARVEAMLARAALLLTERLRGRGGPVGPASISIGVD